MSKYVVTLAPGEVIRDGLTKFIKCPCDCSGVTDIILQNAEGGVVGTFTLCDATGKSTSDMGNVWSAGHHIQVLFDFSAMKAQVLNSGGGGKHASQHATGGSDPITPEMIGAATGNHTHAASQVTAGTFAGAVIANSGGQTPGSYLVRNQKLSATEETPTVNGPICWLYE